MCNEPFFTATKVQQKTGYKMATIQKRIGKEKTSYTATIRLAGYAPITRTFDKKGEAVIWAAETESAIRAKRYTDPGQADKIKLYDAVKRYLAEVTVKKKASTQRREVVAANHIAFALGTEMPISAIDSRLVSKYRDRRLKQVGAYSVRIELALLSHLYKIMQREWGIPCVNPVTGIDRPSPPKGRTRFLSQKEARALLEECGKRRNKMLRPYVLSLLHTGMRPSEAAGLKWRQVDLAKRKILLEDTKTGEDRVVPLTETLVGELVKIKKGREGNDYVFLTSKQAETYASHAGLSQAFRMSFEEARKEAKLKDVRMHDLRHTAASYLLMSGCDLRTLADILGHSGMQMVQRYTHLLDQHKLDAVDKIGGLGFGE